MKFSRKSEYALRALLALAAAVEEAPISVRELAEKNEIPRKFLEAIMGELRENGFVESLAGKKGGYRLNKPAEEITLGEILRHFEGHFSGPEDEEASQEAGSDIFLRVLFEIGEEVDRLVDDVTLAQVLSGAPIVRRQIIEDQEFVFGEGI
ncbi:Rrf2 family transcriptional regulator [bacterium]|nr:Rrf2 family transcriptional regulator [bacterium]